MEELLKVEKESQHRQHAGGCHTGDWTIALDMVNEGLLESRS